MAEETDIVARRRWSRWRLVLVGLFFILLLVAAILWTQRRQIAADFIDDELARRGVQATYDVKRISLGTQRLENLVIGDPGRPDATVKWLEVDVSLRFGRPDVSRITARGVRLFGRVVEGKLSLGSIDKLMPPPTGAPFRLPDQNIDIADAAMTLETEAGRIVLAVAGKGNLADGFRGEIAAAAPRLLLSGCAIDGMRLSSNVAVVARRPSFDGPVGAERLACSDAGIEIAAPRLALDATVPESLDSWLGDARLEARAARFGAGRLGAITGNVGFDGNRALTRGALRLSAAAGRMPDYRADRLSIDGRYAFAAAGGRLSLAADAGASGVAAGGGALRPVTQALAGADGTPLGPLGNALAVAVNRAASGLDAKATLRLVHGPGGGALRVERLAANSGSGARLAIAEGDGLTYYWPHGLIRADGEFALSGGGFPAVRLSLTQPSGRAPVRGEGRIAPFTAGAARLQLAPVRFTAGPGGTTRVETAALLDGPFHDGRVGGLLMPIRGRFGTGGFAFGEECAPVSFRSLDAAGLRLGPTRLAFCPTGRAMLWRRGGGLQGGAEVRAPRLAGRLGESPIVIAADRVGFSIAEPGFAAAGAAVRLGEEDAVSHLDLASLSGRFGARGLTGDFMGGAGRIAHVPLLLSEAKGGWSVIGGKLAIDGGMRVADEAEPSRFHPLVTDDFHLAMVGSRIDATGWLRDPETGTQVTRVTIDHALGSGIGHAVLDVPGIRFDERFQPEELTRLTTGVVALVNGTVEGRGEIGWSPEGTTSSGTFSTKDMNLAANFGPVEKLSTTLHFTDLLGLVSAPGQVATAGLIRTGIDVIDGNVRYQLLPDMKVRVESGRWPFAGGELILEETILDFSKPAPKHLTFRVVGLDAAHFIQQFEFKNISATGTFDGVVPMVFDDRGGQVVGGRLVARAEGGTLSYVGELTDKELGTYGKLAFDALKSLRYDKLVVLLDGSLDGEFLTQIELDGIARNPSGTSVGEGGGVSKMVAGRTLSQLAKIPFEFNITVRGPFRALLATARSLYDPSLLIQTVLPEALRDKPTATTVQPEESETVQ